MTTSVTVTDHETGHSETMELVDYVIVCNAEDGWHIANTTRHGNGTTVLTVKRSAQVVR